VFGQDAYETVSLKAAALMQSLAQNQPFLDGNKRIAWLCGKAFLRINGIRLSATPLDALDLFMNDIAEGMTTSELQHGLINIRRQSKGPKQSR